MPIRRPPGEVLRGLKAGIPVAVGYLPIAVAPGWRIVLATLLASAAGQLLVREEER